jgi:predicted nuclease with TOPRIM domain
MSAYHDASEFIDGDLQGQKSPSSAGAAPLRRAPTREEVDSKVVEAQQKLAELKREQEALERERAGLEETRRRQMEFQTGRQEMVQHLTRGLGLLEEAEFAARRDAEQMAKTVVDLRDSLNKLQAVREETWTGEAFNVELTRGLTVVENSRMEWNAARLKFPLLSGMTQAEAAAAAAEKAKSESILQRYTFGDLCRIGFAMTWPLALVALLGLVALLFFLLRR